VSGVPVPVERGPETELETLERLYAREYQEIGRRVKHVLIFPKRLMLLLEQGESIVEFDLDVGGRVVGDVRVLKSAGFLEFDTEAVSAVRRAAPFPRLRRPLRVRLRLSFDNPVIR
jgi:TonB family protein